MSKVLSPLIQKWIGSAIRAGLVALGMWLMNQKLIDNAMADQLVGFTPILASIAWSFYEKFTSRQKLVTGIAQPRATSEARVEAIIKAGDAVSVTTPKDVTPQA